MVPIGSVFVRVPIFSILAKFTRITRERERTMNKLDMSVMSDDSSAVLNHHLLLQKVSLLVGTVSVIHCWQF